MRTIVIAADEQHATGAEDRVPAFLWPLIDRPFLQHVVESLAAARLVDTVHVVLGRSADRTKNLLGTGSKWGLRICYRTPGEPTRPYGALNSVDGGEEPLLLIHADCLPRLDLNRAGTTEQPLAFCSSGSWTGWAIIDRETRTGIQSSWSRTQLQRWILESARARGTVEECETVLGVRSAAEVLASQRIAFTNGFPGQAPNGREIQPGVWVAGRVTLDPTAILIPPVYLGDQSHIGAVTRVGPNAVVARDCVLDRRTIVADSLILPGSYVGQELELDHVIVDRNRLTAVKVEGEVVVPDDFILSGVARPADDPSFLQFLRGLIDIAGERLQLPGIARHRRSRQPHSDATDLVRRRKSIELRVLEERLTHGPRHFLFRHENILRPVLKSGLKAVGLLKRGERNALRPQVRALPISFDNLPPGMCGFQILQLSDLHVDGMRGLAERVVELISPLEVDLCVLTGDYRFATSGHCDSVYPEMRKIVDAINSRYGVLGILGNHDYAEEIPELEAMGVQMLMNRAVEIGGGDHGKVWVIGVDDDWDYHCADLPGALSGVPDDAFRILLAHSPDLIDEAAGAGIDLYLCGHTHAGQIRLPFIGATMVPANCERRFIQGRWKQRDMEGYTSAGVGCSLLPVRFRCPPEIGLVELRCGASCQGKGCPAQRCEVEVTA